MAKRPANSRRPGQASEEDIVAAAAALPDEDEAPPEQEAGGEGSEEGGEPESGGEESGHEEEAAGGDAEEAAPAGGHDDPHAARIRAEAERDLLRQQLAEHQQRQGGGQQQQAPQQSKWPGEKSPDEVALMDPTERDGHETKRQLWQMQQQMRELGMRSQDSTEFSSFHSKAQAHAIYKEYAPKVEHVLAAMRKQGKSESRETILRVLIGDDAIKKYDAEKAKPQKKPTASAAKPPPNRGNGAAPPGRSGKGDDLASLEKRLAGVAL